MINKTFFKEFKRLNAKQREAVEAIEGPVMVIAGPGTGKTQILAMRIANILKEAQIEPGNILALTFTNSGVWAMKKRLLEIIGPASYRIHVHTFHSFCNEVIQTFPEKFVFADRLNQLSDLDQVLIIQDILTNTDFKKIKVFKSPYYYQKTILDCIKQLKQENISPGAFKKIVTKAIKEVESLPDLRHEKGASVGEIKTKYTTRLEQLAKNLELAEAYALYQKELTRLGQYDFADMIIFVAQKLKKDKGLLSFYQEKFQYILVDEYQDTNSAQNEVVRLLASFYDQPNLFVVGDDEQSIFRFQGAALENILDFVKLYPQTKIIVLKDNYRSGQAILDASRSVIEHNTQQIFSLLHIDKKLLSQTATKAQIFAAQFSSNSIEDFFIFREIKKLLRRGVDPSQIACIYKEHRDGAGLADLLARQEVPFSQNNSENILKDHDIFKIINFLRAIANPHQNDNLFEIMNYSFLNLAQLDIYRLANFASIQRKDIFDILTEEHSIELKHPASVKRFLKCLLSSLTNFHNQTFAQAFETLINDCGYLKYLLSLPDAPIKLNRLKSLFDEIKVLNTKEKGLNLRSFLDYIDELQKNNLAILEEPLDINFSGAKLLTAHQSKGLEFEYVFILHLTSGRWGNSLKRQLIKLPEGLLKNQTTAEESEEEERRLFYVSLTRAKKTLYLTSAEQYRENTSREMVSNFVNEIPTKLVKKIKTKPYEQQFAKRLKVSLSAPPKHNQDLKKFLKSLAEKYILNATGFNAYLTCPREFFFNHLLRIPRVKDFNLSYGTGIHFAMEQFFKKQIKDLKLPSKQDLLKFYKTGLNREILAPKDFDRALKQGQKNLSEYFDFYSSEWKKKIPLAVEYSFNYHNVHFEDIPINGKIDKIELLEKGEKRVKIIDYKTGQPKSLNHLLGKTQEQDMSFLYQAFFYKLLAENDPLFTWTVSEVEFEFLTREHDKYFKVNLPIDQASYDNFKAELHRVYSEIFKLQFEPDRSICRKRHGQCNYLEIC